MNPCGNADNMVNILTDPVSINRCKNEMNSTIYLFIILFLYDT